MPFPFSPRPGRARPLALPSPAGRRRARPRCERLEDRTLLTGETLANALPLAFRADNTAALTAYLATPQDVEIVRLPLAPGDTVTAAVNTGPYGGALDGYLRVFDAAGAEIAANDNFAGRDPRLTFQAAAAGDYYVGVSAAGNVAYDPRVAHGGQGGSHGLFDLSLTRSAAPPAPAVAGAAFQLAGGPAEWGDSVTAMYVIENRGGLASAPFTADVRLAADNRLAGVGLTLQTIPVPALPSGGSARGQLQITLPGPLGTPPAGLPESGQVFVGLRLHSPSAAGPAPEQGNDWDGLSLITPHAVLGPHTTTAGADLLPLNSRATGALTPGAPVAYFQVAPDTAGRLTVRVHAGGPGARLSLLDSQGRLLIQSDGQSPGNPDPQIDQHLDGQEGGTTYYLQLQGAAGAYALTTQFAPAALPFQDISIGTTAQAVAAGDFNGDGFSDLVTVNANPGDPSSSDLNDVSVFLGKPDGTFEDPLHFAVGNKPTAVVVGHFSDSGHLDVATANSGSGDLSVLLGNGDGTFRPQQRYPVGPSPQAVVAGDFTGGKHDDLAVAFSGDDSDPGGVAVLLGDGHGAFAGPTTYRVGSGPFGLTVGRFRQGGPVDLAVANTGSGDVSVLLGDGNGTFQEARDSDGNPLRPKAGSTPLALVAGDFDSTGHDSLAVANRDSKDVSVLRGNGDGTFQDQVHYPVRATPTAIVAGDFTGTGRTDLAVTNADDGTVSVLLNQADGTGAFQDMKSYPVDAKPYSLVATRLGLDKSLDLVAVNRDGKDLSFLVGNGDGTFQGAPQPGVATNPQAVAAGDFNGDGVMDLVTADYGANGDVEPVNDVAVLLGVGDGTFAPPVRYAVGAGATAVVVGDFNGDGALDLATANRDSNDVSVLLGKGDGTFGGAVSYAAGAGPVALAVADFAGSGHLGLAVADGGFDSNGDPVGQEGVSVLLGKGDGTFADAVRYAAGAVPSAIVAGDFNGDGRPDLAVANRGSDDVSVLLGNGDGTFRGKAFYGVGAFPSALVAGDFNGDGLLDLATANQNSSDVSILLGRGDGTFREDRDGHGAAIRPAAGNNPFSLTTGDFDGDGHLDLATANGSQDVSVLLGHGDGTFTTETRFVGGGQPSTLLAGTFDGTGHVSLVTANLGSHDVSVLIGGGDGTFLTPVKFTAGSPPAAVVADDLRGVGITDLVTADPNTDEVSVLLGLGDGTFRPAVRYKAGKAPVAVAVGDFNGDGRPDLAVANSGSDDVSVLLGLGDGTFAAPVDYAAGAAPASLVACQLAPGGPLDLVVANSGSDDVSVLLGLGDGTFREGLRYPVGHDPVALVAGQFTAAGPTDLAVANAGSDDVSVLLGDGDGTFTHAADYKVGTAPSALVAGQFTATGHLDLAVANRGSDDVSVLLGLGDGTFREAQDGHGNPLRPGVGQQPSALAAGYFDGSGNLGLAVADQQTNDVTVLLGNGDGTFPRQLLENVGSAPAGIVAGDFNHDGNVDFATANLASADVSVLLGQGPARAFNPVDTAPSPVRSAPLLVGLGDGGQPGAAVLTQGGEILFRRPTATPGVFGPPVVVNPDPSDAARDVAVVRGPGPARLAALVPQRSALTFFSRGPDGLFRRADGPAVPSGTPVRVAAGDLNGDGRDDLVVAADGSNMVFIYLQQADGSFPPAPDYSLGVGVNPSDVTLADVDGDGRPDVVVTNQSSGDVSVLLNDAPNPFSSERRYRGTTGLHGLDANGDVRSAGQLAGAAAAAAGGVTDLAVINRDTDSLLVLRGNGAGGFFDPGPALAFPTGRRPTAVVAGRFSQGPGPDFAVLDEGSDDISLFLSDGHGGFTERPATDGSGNKIRLDGASPTGLSAAYLSPDGHLDLLVGNGFGDVLVLLGNGDGTFRPLTGDRVALAAVGGLPGDSRPHAFVADPRQDAVSFQTQAAGRDPFQPGAALAPADDPASQVAVGAVQVARLEGPGGPLDLVVLAAGSNSVLVYHNIRVDAAGRPVFDLNTTRDVYFVGTNPVGLTIQNVKGAGADGVLVPDILIADQGSNDIAVLFGSVVDGRWVGAPGPRLRAGGSGPVAVSVVPDPNSPGGSDLAVTNAQSRTVTVLPGRGQGFFDDRNPQALPLGPVGAPLPPVPGPGGMPLVPGPAAIIPLPTPAVPQPNPVFVAPPGQTIAAVGPAPNGGLVIAVLAGGSVEVELLRPDAQTGALIAGEVFVPLNPNELPSAPSAVAVLETADGGLEALVTSAGQDQVFVFLEGAAAGPGAGQDQVFVFLEGAAAGPVPAPIPPLPPEPSPFPTPVIVATPTANAPLVLLFTLEPPEPPAEGPDAAGGGRGNGPASTVTNVFGAAALLGVLNAGEEDEALADAGAGDLGPSLNDALRTIDLYRPDEEAGGPVSDAHPPGGPNASALALAALAREGPDGWPTPLWDEALALAFPDGPAAPPPEGPAPPAVGTGAPVGPPPVGPVAAPLPQVPAVAATDSGAAPSSEGTVSLPGPERPADGPRGAEPVRGPGQAWLALLGIAWAGLWGTREPPAEERLPVTRRRSLRRRAGCDRG
jgi:hypothetical protein